MHTNDQQVVESGRTSLSQLTPSSPQHSVKRQLLLKSMFSTLRQLEGKRGQSLGLDNSQQN
jgi:hypothetical protein